MDTNAVKEPEPALPSAASRGRRTKNWWEPMFDANAPASFSVSDWNFSNNRGPRCTLFLAEKMPDATTLVVKDIDFQDCDFQGTFERKIVFKDCKFTRCDFGLSTFSRTKFSGCSFYASSFTQCTLENCEFRNCKYEKIFYSGNETQIPRTLIAEPYQFLFGACATVDSVPQGKSRFEQRARFEETRSTIARALLANLHSEGSEDTYYAAVKASTLSENRARIARALIKINSSASKGKSIISRAVSFLTGFASAISAVVGMLILLVMGSLNGWGSSISRAMLVGVVAISCVAYRYHYRFNLPPEDAMVKATEIFFLFGYTNYAKMGQEDFHLVFSNALLGLFWYAIAIPTISNRLTRARG